MVDVEHGESLVGAGFSDASVVADLGVVADAAEEVVGDAGGAAAAAGDFPCAVFFDGDVEETGGADDDVAELLGGVVVKPFFDGEAAEERAGEESAARGGADEGKVGKVDADASGVGSLVDDDVQFEVFHSGVEVFFDVFLHTVDFVDEQHVSSFEVGEQASKISRFFDSGSAGAFEVGFHGFGDDVGQRGLSQSGRAGEEDVIEDVASLFGGGHGNFQAFFDFVLAGEIGKPRGAKRKFERRIGLVERIQSADCRVLCFFLPIFFCLFWLGSMFCSFFFGFFCNDFSRFENVFGVRIRLEKSSTARKVLRSESQR